MFANISLAATQFYRQQSYTLFFAIQCVIIPWKHYLNVRRKELQLHFLLALTKRDASPDKNTTLNKCGFSIQ